MPIFLSGTATGVDYSAATKAVEDAMTGLGTNCMTALGVILPAGLALFAAVVIVGFSKRVFQKISGSH